MVIWNRTPFAPWDSPLGLTAGPADALLGLFADLASPLHGPAIQLDATDRQLSLVALVPGLAPEDLQVSLEGQTLELSREAKEGGAAGFRRSLRLPFPVEPDSVRAELRDGRLVVHAERLAADAPRTIPVRLESN